MSQSWHRVSNYPEEEQPRSRSVPSNEWTAQGLDDFALKLVVEATEDVGVAHVRVVAFPLLMERLGELPGGCCEGDLCSPRHRCFLEILGGVNASTEHGADSQRLAPRASSPPLPGAPGWGALHGEHGEVLPCNVRRVVQHSRGQRLHHGVLQPTHFSLHSGCVGGPILFTIQRGQNTFV